MTYLKADSKTQATIGKKGRYYSVYFFGPRPDDYYRDFLSVKDALSFAIAFGVSELKSTSCKVYTEAQIARIMEA